MRVRANAFLHHMVRNLAGWLIAVGRASVSVSDTLDVLAGRDRRLAGTTAPATGLYFYRVGYPAAFGLPGPVKRRPDPLLSRAMSWFEKIMPSRIKTERRTRSVPEGLWIKCAACDSVLYRAELERNLNVCPKCSHHMRIGARERLATFLDPEFGRWSLPPVPRAERSAQVPRQQEIQRPADCRRRKAPAKKMRWSSCTACCWDAGRGDGV